MAHHPHGLSVMDELEQNRQQAKPSAIDDGGTAEDDHIHIAGVAREDFFGGKFGTP
jgi:hypothetical protein